MNSHPTQAALVTVVAAIVSLTSRTASAEAPVSRRLTLAEAEQLALTNAPRFQASKLEEQAAGQGVREARAAYFPTVNANVTGTLAQEGTTIAAGALATSSLSSRASAGVGVSQLVTDFGHTSHLVGSAELQAQARHEQTEDERAQLLLEVRQAYYAVLSSQAVFAAVNAALESRRTTARQIAALAQRQLKSTLDLSFAQVLVSDAELGVYRADSDVDESRARLMVAIGAEQLESFELADVALPSALEPESSPLVAEAFKRRPDLRALQSKRDAAAAFAEAQKGLNYPTLSLQGAAGWTPFHDASLHVNDYAAVGLNLHVPLFTGWLFTAQEQKASLEAQADDKDAQDLRLRVARQVRTAWFEAMNAFRRLDVTERLVAQANESLRLAHARYDQGLGGIVELNEAEVTQTAAELESSRARYDYLSRRAALDYAVGLLSQD